MEREIKCVAIGTAIVYVIYTIWYVLGLADAGSLNSLGSILSLFVSILKDIVLFFGCFGVGCLLEDVMDIREILVWMINSERRKKENWTAAHSMHDQNPIYQNSMNYNQNYQETEYADREPLNTGWICSCGCENDKNSLFCIKCGQKRI